MTNLTRAAALICSGFIAVWTTRAASLDSVVVTYEDGRYKLVADAYMDAPREAIFLVLTDYDGFGRISGTYKEYGFLDPTPEGVPVVFTQMAGCVLVFCISMRRVERLEAQAPGFIRTVILPEQSDFRYGLSEWWLEPEATGTRVTYQMAMEPDFWIPPIIGPWMLQRRLQRGGVTAVQRIEGLAQELSSPAATPD